MCVCVCVCVCACVVCVLHQCVLLLYCPVASTHETSNLVEELDASRCHAVRCAVLGACEGKALLEALQMGVRDHQRVHLIVQLLTHMEQGTATRAKHPLVEVACRNNSDYLILFWGREWCRSIPYVTESQVADL